MNSQHSDHPSNLTGTMKEISAQFDKAITELTKTAELIGQSIKTSLDDFSRAVSEEMSEKFANDVNEATSVEIPESSSVDTPDILPDRVMSSSDQVDPEAKSILMLNDMVSLLEVNDAVDELYSVLEILGGSDLASSDGLMFKLNKIISVIVNASVTRNPQEEERTQETGTDADKWIYKLLNDKTIDNEQKAKILLGLAE